MKKKKLLIFLLISISILFSSYFNYKENQEKLLQAKIEMGIIKK